MFYIVIMLLTCMSIVDCVKTSVYERMCDRDKAIVDAFNKALVYFKKTDVQTITLNQFLRIVGNDDDTKRIILNHFKNYDVHGLADELNDYMFFDLVYAVAHGRGVSPDSLPSEMNRNMIKKKKKNPKHAVCLKCEETQDEVELSVESSSNLAN
ncbi:uncharacterized protein LOC126842065 [Adelges cooleyi]|uniref:uncharacterized protein LOC126842065 n=1 Tax=Adelges cooleyi TaxID=133065 RepID=UPI00217F6701|nr:uncharacterized protein LOC126842065 [Adelges cooleyi]